MTDQDTEPGSSWLSDFGHGALDVLGLVPGVGEVADGVNALWYAAEGDYVNAGLSAAAMVPFAGAAVVGFRGLRHLDAVIDNPASSASADRLHRQLSEEAGRLPGVRSLADIFATPSVLSGGATPDQVRPLLHGENGWVEETLRRGRNVGGGWVAREYTDR